MVEGFRSTWEGEQEYVFLETDSSRGLIDMKDRRDIGVVVNKEVGGVSMQSSPGGCLVNRWSCV